MDDPTIKRINQQWLYKSYDIFVLELILNQYNLWNHCHKKRKDNLETRAELVVLRSYVENQQAS